MLFLTLRSALSNWFPMVRLAIPGFVMVEAECLAFEILTLAASYFDTSHLAAQSVLSTLTCITFQYVSVVLLSLLPSLFL